MERCGRVEVEVEVAADRRAQRLVGPPMFGVRLRLFYSRWSLIPVVSRWTVGAAFTLFYGCGSWALYLLLRALG